MKRERLSEKTKASINNISQGEVTYQINIEPTESNTLCLVRAWCKPIYINYCYYVQLILNFTEANPTKVYIIKQQNHQDTNKTGFNNLNQQGLNQQKHSRDKNQNFYI